VPKETKLSQGSFKNSSQREPKLENHSKSYKFFSLSFLFEGFPQMGVPTMRVRAESVPTFTFLQKWFQTSAKGETKSNKNKIFEEV